MKACSNCGAQNDPNARFCLKCGAKLIDQTPNPASTPAPQAKDEGFGSLVGDKNIINKSTLVAKQENENYTAQQMTVHNTTIKDDTREMVECAISGHHILKGESAVCPACGATVSKQYMVDRSRRCQNCEEQAHDTYRAFAAELVGGTVVDATAKQQLDARAKALKIDDATQEAILRSLRQRPATAKSDVLTSVQRSELEAAVRHLIGADSREEALKSLETIDVLREHTANEEVDHWYFLARAIVDPVASVEAYEAELTDNFWQRYWGFLAYLNTESPKAATALDRARATFGARENDIRLAEVAYYLARGYDSFDQSMIDRAGALIDSVDPKELSAPLAMLYGAVQTVGSKGITIDNAYTAEDMFFFLYVFRAGNYVRHLYAEHERKEKEAAEAAERKTRHEQEERARRENEQQALERARQQKQAAMAADASKRMAAEMARLEGAKPTAAARAKTPANAKAFAGYDTPVPAKKSNLTRNILIGVVIVIVLIGVLFLIPMDWVQ